MRRASLEFPAALRRLGARVDLDPRPLLDVARRDPAAAALEREYRGAARGRAGAPVDDGVEPAARSGAWAAGAIRTAGFVLDPYRACLAALDASVAKGATVFERLEVLRIRARTRSVEVTTDGGTVSAATVVIAGGASIPDLRHAPAAPAGTARLCGRHRPFRRRRSSAGSEPARPVLRFGDDPAAVRKVASGRPGSGRGADQDPVPVRAREQAVDPALRPAHVRAFVGLPGDLRDPSRMGMVAPLRRHSGRSPIYRQPPEFPAPPVRPRPRPAWRRRIVAGRADTRRGTCAGTPAKGDDLFGFSRILQPH